MQPKSWKLWLYRLNGAIGVLAFSAIILLGVFAHVFPTVSRAWPLIVKVWPSIVPAHTWIESNLAWLIALLGVVVTTTGLVAKRIGSPWFWHTVAHIIDGLHSQIFADLPGGEVEDHHRVTLYQWRRFCWWPAGTIKTSKWFWGRSPIGKLNWPWSGWMVPVVRSGVRSKGKTIFLSKSDPESQGIAGTAYFHHKPMEIDNLPDVHNDGSAETLKTYADRTYSPVEWITQRVNRQEPCARCFHAIRIRVGKDWWGVIMIDSRSKCIPDGDITIPRFQTISTALECLLERV